MIQYDAPADGQPQTCPPFFGSEERFKDMCELVLIYPATVITDGELHEFAWNGAWFIGAVRFIDAAVVSFNGDLADTCDGISGIDAKIGEYLIDL